MNTFIPVPSLRSICAMRCWMLLKVGDLACRGEFVVMVMEIGSGYYADFARCWVLNGSLEEHWILQSLLEPL